MRAKLLTAAILLQLLFLGAFALMWERLYHDGYTVFLRTVPLDPRDPLRGDYLALNYDINQVPMSAYRGPAASTSLRRGDRLYAALRPGQGGVYHLKALYSEPPAGDIFIAGRLERRGEQQLQLRYGIEQLYRQQGEAKQMELMQRGSDHVPRPLDIELAVDEQGRALIRGYRWADLGVAVSWKESARQPDSAANILEVRIHNFSADTIWLMDDPQHCAFAFTGESQAAVIQRGQCETPAPQRIAAGADYRFSLPVLFRQWQLRELAAQGRAPELQRRSGPLRLQLRYSSPVGGLSADAWRGELLSMPLWMPSP